MLVRFISAVQHNAIPAKDLEFDSRADQIRHIVANDSPPLRCFFGAVFPALSHGDELSPATRCTPRLNTASIMKI